MFDSILEAMRWFERKSFEGAWEVVEVPPTHLLALGTALLMTGEGQEPQWMAARKLVVLNMVPSHQLPASCKANRVMVRAAKMVLDRCLKEAHKDFQV